MSNITQRIQNIGITFADDTSRKNYFTFATARREGVCDKPLLVISGMPESRKLAAARLAIGLCAENEEALASDGAPLELGPENLLSIVQVDLLESPEDLAEGAELVRLAATPSAEGEPARFVVVIANAWFPLSSDHEEKSLRVNLMPVAGS